MTDVMGLAACVVAILALGVFLVRLAGHVQPTGKRDHDEWEARGDTFRSSAASDHDDPDDA